MWERRMGVNGMTQKIGQKAFIVTMALIVSGLGMFIVPQQAGAEAWVKSDMGAPPGGNMRFFGVVAGDGDRDNLPEVYFTAREGGGVYQYTYSPTAGNWTIESIAGQGFMADAVVLGDGDDSGDRELYVIGMSRGFPGPKVGVYQLYNPGTGWRQDVVSSVGSTGNELALGDGNNDNRTEVFGACADGHIYMYYKMGAWNSQDIGNASPVQNTSSTSMESVIVGDGDNDGRLEVYGSASTGWIYQFNYIDATSSWARSDVGQGATGKAGSNMASIAIGDVNGDGQNEVFGASWNNATVYMFKYDPKTVMWDRTTLVSLGTQVNALGLAIGDGNSDGSDELFAGTSNSQVYMIRYDKSTSSWGSSSVGSGNGQINDVTVGMAMGDPSQREVYAACQDGHGYHYLVDRAPPANPTLWSDTHPVPGTWYANSVVHMLWSDVGKDPSGIDGYSLAWDSAPSTIPDSFKEVEENVHEVTSPALSPGKWYFHIRSRDNALNWNASAAHFGPICIGSAPDDAPPTISDVLASGITDNLAVIGWSTNEPADSLLEYGSTDNYGLKASGVAFVLGHSITLTGLSASTTYHFRVGSRDASGNGPTWSGDFSFKTLAKPDTVPPVISNVKVGGITDRVAVVSWETDEPADGSVDYGSGTSYGLVKSDGSFVMLHEIALSGLNASTTYHFRARSRDATGNGPTLSLDFSFLTAAQPDRTPPQIASARVEGITQNSATVLWETDELGDSFVEYGPGVSYGLSSADKTYTLHHSVLLQDLSVDRTYHFRAMSADSSGNTGIGPDLTFKTEKTPSQPDTTPPRISAIDVSGVTNSRAVVMWTTDELAGSEVEYGKTSGYGLRSSDPTFANIHSIVLENLNASTTYHFRVKSSDVSGNGPSVSQDQEFRTVAAPDATPPRISAIKVTGITSNSATVTWSTDEPSTSVVDFGNGTQYGRKLTSQLNVLLHGLVLTGLQPATTYHFRVCSTDPTGNTAAPSADMIFTTLRSAATTTSKNNAFPWVWVALAILVVLGIAGAYMAFGRRTPIARSEAVTGDDDVETLQMETEPVHDGEPVRQAGPARHQAAPRTRVVGPAPAAEILAPLTIPPPAPLRHIRCPHCRARIPIHREGPHGITCQGCGRSGYYRPKAVGTATQPQENSAVGSEGGGKPGPVRVASCPACGSEVPIYTAVYPVRVSCPGCGRSGVFKGPGA
jgi:hypothetical protein